MVNRLYDHKSIEAKWQRYWFERKTFMSQQRSNRPKYYVLDMFPYPSGSGLHVGHVEGYTATDILARYKRMRGFNVLHPMGWDSFGLPAEQYAIRTGTHPAETTKTNIETFTRQLRSLGFSYDWDRQFATSDPSYFKWTQWIFTQLYERGLAYEAEVNVNYCPALGTVLANEEVEEGHSKEGGHVVERRPLKQWILKITSYADRLIEDLDLVDWPEGLKKLQVNWIGRSEGATVDFTVEGSSDLISIFTTRPDTLFGVTYLVLAPEHPSIAKITTDCQLQSVEEYKRQASFKSDMDRTELCKEKSGVFTGAYAIHPLTKEKVPIWVGDYVLPNYGTGAIMAVPAHDERDFDFAKRYHLPTQIVYRADSASEGQERVAGEQAEQQTTPSCRPASGKCINSQTDSITLNGLEVKEATRAIIDYLQRSGQGRGSISYKLRDWLFSRQRYWGEPFPILHFEDGTKRTLQLDELPLLPPEITDYKPSGDGQSPLARQKQWIEILDHKTGKKALRESNTMPNWAGSCWYYLRFCDPSNSTKAWSKEAADYWLPVDMYIGGVEHAILHLLYARFWHKVFYDMGLVSTLEPFQTLRNQGLIVSRSFQRKNGSYVDAEKVKESHGEFLCSETGEKLRSQIEKMSKSKLNGVSPDEIIAEFGADSLRLYEMFMGPLEKEKPWCNSAVNGCRRFLKRFFEMIISPKVGEKEDETALRLGHRLVYGVQKDIEAMQFNTAIAKMMEFINQFTKLTIYPKSVLAMAVQALSPFAPHIAEECWQMLGRKEELSYQPWPVVDDSYLVDELVTYVVQINGKVRERLELPCDQEQEMVKKRAYESSSISSYLRDRVIVKEIFVPNKLLNFVIE